MATYKSKMVWGTVYDTWYEIVVADREGQPIEEYTGGWGSQSYSQSTPPSRKQTFNECLETCEDMAKEHGISKEYIDCRMEEDW